MYLLIKIHGFGLERGRGCTTRCTCGEEKGGMAWDGEGNKIIKLNYRFGYRHNTKSQLRALKPT